MIPALALALLPIFAPTDPARAVTAGAVLSPQAQWEAISASPRVISKGKVHTAATAVVIGQKDEYAYLLTAEHALAEPGKREFQFFSPEKYPEPALKLEGEVLVLSSKVADFALLKMKIGNAVLPQVALASPGDRPKRFPFEAVSVGSTLGLPPSALAEKIVDKRYGRRGDPKTEFSVAFFWETAKSPEVGRSGGPLFSAQGKVIGLCAASKDGKGYYCHLDEILAELKKENYGWLWEGGDK